MTGLIDISDFDENFFDKIRSAENIISLSDKDRKANNPSFVGRVLLGYMLKRNFGLERFSFCYGENQKPYLKNEDIFFNISHSGKYVLCTVDSKETGCDIQVNTVFNERIAKRFFAENEYRLLKNSSDKDKLFTKLWVMKESILKKEGSGISGGVSTYDFSAYVDENFFEYCGNKFSCFDTGDAQICVCSVNFCHQIETVTKAEFENYIDGIK